MKSILLILGLFVVVATTQAAIEGRALEYKQGDVTLEGWMVRNTTAAKDGPAIVVVHQWKGLGEYEKRRAQMLAEFGYSVLCADIYGKGVRPSNAQEAAEMAGKFKSDRALLRARVQAAVDALQKQTGVKKEKVAAIGYCFGGTAVLELARSGSDVAGVVSFHGGLSTPTSDETGKIRTRVLALHGADDPFVPPAEVAAFKEEMQKGKVDWQLDIYGNAVHSFTDFNAGNDPSKGAAYNEKADRRSWEAMKIFFGEVFAR